MTSITQIEEVFGSLERAVGNQWSLHTLAQDRLHLSVSQDGQSTIFIEGSADSFGRLPILRGVEHRDDAEDVQSRRVFGALRVTATPDPHGNQAVAFIAFEMARTLDREPDVDNSDLLSRVHWILALLGREPAVLSSERQRGLVAECLMLRRLLQIGRAHSIGAQAVLDRWWGPEGGKRDFAAVGVAIEVKSTALNARNHHISSIDQIEPLSSGEKAYLYSMGIKSELTYERKLPTYLADAASEMIRPDGSPDVDAAYAFNQKLASAGYDPQVEGLYVAEPGLLPNPALSPKLFRVEDLDRVRVSSFKGDRLPGMVTALSYDLQVAAPPMSEAKTEEALLSLISSPAL